MFIVIVCILVVVLYFIAIMPRMNKRPDDSYLRNWHYAHRGFHDNKSAAPENSMAAFKKAVEAGYGIEFDVQLTKDRVPVVFHDETLKRVCGAPGKVRDYTYVQLRQFTLCESEERIPLFSEVLKMVDGKVPLIIEIKIHEEYTKVCKCVDAVLKQYDGPYCIESFHPQAVLWYKQNRPRVIRGQLSSDLNAGEKKFSWGYFAVTHLLTNFLSKPDFIAYDHKYSNNVSRILCRKLYKALSVAWTIRSQEGLNRVRDEYELFIFEGFVPK